jgi:hypothetical protein
MKLTFGDIEFGETDAKHEVFAQAREGTYVLLNAFQMPPSVKFEKLLTGAKFFISGLKGTGKTSLILYLKDQIDKSGGRSHAILFKSKLTDAERQRLAPIADLTAFIDQDKIKFEHEYKVNWLWYIISEFSRLIEPSDLLEGKDQLHDLKILTGAKQPSSRSMFSGLQLTKIKATLETALSAGPLKTGVKAEIEAISAPKEEKFIHLVDICERLLYSLKPAPGFRTCLFFDELELFIGKIDQKERDLHLIRDLLYAVSRINQGFGPENSSICAYASVRSEVMYEINRIDPEISREVSDFGVSIDWHGTRSTPDQSILKIVESKIQYAELNSDGIQTQDIWNGYFEESLQGTSAKQYLLDISMFKPRTLVMLMSTISEQVPDAEKVNSEILKQVETTFANEMWREVEEELRTSYDAESVRTIKSSLRGIKIRTNIQNLENHIIKYCQQDDVARSILGSRPKIRNLLESLYRVGAIGTQFTGKNGNSEVVRDAWVFRHSYEPQFGGAILFHKSLRKALQLT